MSDPHDRLTLSSTKGSTCSVTTLIRHRLDASAVPLGTMLRRVAPISTLLRLPCLRALMRKTTHLISLSAVRAMPFAGGTRPGCFIVLSFYVWTSILLLFCCSVNTEHRTTRAMSDPRGTLTLSNQSKGSTCPSQSRWWSSRSRSRSPRFRSLR